MCTKEHTIKICSENVKTSCSSMAQHWSAFLTAGEPHRHFNLNASGFSPLLWFWLSRWTTIAGYVIILSLHGSNKAGHCTVLYCEFYSARLWPTVEIGDKSSDHQLPWRQKFRDLQSINELTQNISAQLEKPNTSTQVDTSQNRDRTKIWKFKFSMKWTTFSM